MARLLILLLLCLNAKATDLFYTDEGFAKDEIEIENLPSFKDMELEQIDLIKREFKGNIAPFDSIYYKQREIQKEIEKDSTLKILPESSEEMQDFGDSKWYEFSISYTFKLVDDMPIGEVYKVAIPLVSNAYKKIIAKTCNINTKEKHYSIKTYPHYTEAQARANAKKQTQKILYQFLHDYKSEVILCLIQHKAHIDDINTNINLESRTKTIANLKASILAKFSGGILTIQIIEEKK